MKSRVPTKEELLKFMEKDTEHWVSNYVWSFHRMEDGNILGCCNEKDCCFLEYKDFEEMYNHYDKEKWRICK